MHVAPPALRDADHLYAMKPNPIPFVIEYVSGMKMIASSAGKPIARSCKWRRASRWVKHQSRRPGEGFRPSGSAWARLSLATPDELIDVGLERLEIALK